MVLDFLPAYSTWDEWNGNLLHYFSEQQFPRLPEIQWQEVARAVTVNPVFDKYAVAAPETFGLEAAAIGTVRLLLRAGEAAAAQHATDPRARIERLKGSRQSDRGLAQHRVDRAG